MTPRQTRMLASALIGCACVLLVLPAGAAAEEFDRTFDVRRGTSLDIRLFGGDVVVRGWDQDRVRLRATHFKTDLIDAKVAKSTLTIRARAKVGSPHAIDLTIDVPSWMAVSIAGTYVDVSVSGVRASISAETVRGDVRVSGAKGGISLKSIEGDVTLDDATGRASLTAVNNGVRVRRFDGALVVATVSGAVTLERVTSTSVDVGTVGGDISWHGELASSGRYQFATHTGDIDVSLGPNPDAAVTVRLFDGQFRSAFDGGDRTGPDGRKRFTTRLGAGTAHLDLETFRGTISLRQ